MLLADGNGPVDITAVLSPVPTITTASQAASQVIETVQKSFWAYWPWILGAIILAWFIWWLLRGQK